MEFKIRVHKNHKKIMITFATVQFGSEKKAFADDENRT